LGQPARGLDALSALRNDLLAGGRTETARTASATRQARQRTATLAAASYARQQHAPAKQVPSIQVPAGTPPSGAIAARGGWFSETMLTALGKYEDDANLAHPAAVREAR